MSEWRFSIPHHCIVGAPSLLYRAAGGGGGWRFITIQKNIESLWLGVQIFLVETGLPLFYYFTFQSHLFCNWGK